MGTPISGFTAKLATMRLSKLRKKKRISSQSTTKRNRRGWKRFLDTNSIGFGLSRVSTTGALSKRAKKWWQWDNGDPITYANWLPNEFFFQSLDANERDYAVMTLSDGKWYAVSPDSVIWDMTEMAILEKADVLDNPSAAERQ